MEVILLTKVDNLGDLGDKVSVRPGYARNFLIPSGKAKFATSANLAEFEARRAELEKLAADSLAAAVARKTEIDGAKISITAKSVGEGKLFGSVGMVDIVNALNEAGKNVEKKEVRLPDGAFHHAGEYQVEVHIHTDVNATINLEIIGEE
ncbi:MAG: 50S ribosomal protein L9 [Gammaproteobacteria bacterium]|nr:MAG: 50S ribosomal protein L9 [Gammaproteobacteria bacterium]